jgi:hypothetical protein
MVGVHKRKIQLAISLFLVMFYFSALPVQAKYGGGSRQHGDLYLIHTTEQMNAIGANPNDWDKQFKLMADIDLSALDGKEGRPAFNIIGASSDNDFTGVFDGNHHTISNFRYTSTDANVIGFFGYVDDPREEIGNLGLIDPNIDSGIGDYLGSLVGWLRGGTIISCYVEGGSVSGTDCVGGLVGYNLGTITNCNSDASAISINRVSCLNWDS